MFTIIDGINRLIEGSTISKNEIEDVMRDIMSGKTQDSQIASFLTALRIRGETPEVIEGAASVMRELASRITPMEADQLVDTCGTGGDHSGTFNISTIVALIAAGAGIPIAKHGNRSISSKCGSADLLEGFGVKVDLDPVEVSKIIAKIGLGFMFAPKFHPAMKFAMPVRKSLAMRTIFNILGPLTNPASAKNHVLGVFDPALVEPITKVMASLGSKRIFVVNSAPGIDEIVPISEVKFGELFRGKIRFYSLHPNDFGIEKLSLDELKGGSLEENLKIAANILNNKDQGIKRKIALINAAYAIVAGGGAKNYSEGLKKADEALTSGAALDKLKQLVVESKGNLDQFSKIVGGK